MTLSWRVLVLGVWLALCVTVPGVAVVWLLDAGPRHARAAVELAPKATTIAVSPEPDRDESPAQRLDVYGNEIARPVATYRVDRQGTLYEVHSPDTEVPRLRSPRL